MVKIFAEHDVIDAFAPIEVQLKQIIGHPPWSPVAIKDLQEEIRRKLGDPLWTRGVNFFIEMIAPSRALPRLDWRLSEVNAEYQYLHGTVMRMPPEFVVKKMKLIRVHFPRARFYIWYFGEDPILVFQHDTIRGISEYYPLVYDVDRFGEAVMTWPK